MRKFYLFAFVSYLCILAAATVMHYFGFSPYGGKLETDPLHYLPFALSAEILLLLVLTIVFQIVDRMAGRRGSLVKAVYLVFVVLYLALNLLDLFMFRWMGAHLSASYFRTFFGQGAKYLSPGGFHFAARLVGSDFGQVLASVLLGVGGAFLGVFLWRNRRTLGVKVRSPWYTVVLALALVGSLTVYVGATEDVKERVTPAIVSMVQDGLRTMTGADEPSDQDLALARLTGLARIGRPEPPNRTASGSFPQSADYPLLQGLNPSEAAQAASRPNIILLELESWRGWETGLAANPGQRSNTPELDEFLAERSVYYPWTHANGFPSAAGTLCILLGLLPHQNKFVTTDYPDLSAQSLPELLRQNGYYTEILVGADPDISNFTSWFNRWFDTVYYRPEINEDHLLIDTMIGRTQDLSARDTPYYLHLYSISAHIPFYVPESEGIAPAETLEERFDQVIGYSTRHVRRFLDYLAASPEWDNTVVILIGDHAYPQKEHTEMELELGNMHPGLTWTHLAFTGGWSGLPAHGRRDEVASQIDVASTLVGLLNLKGEHQFMGRDLFSEPERPVLSLRRRDVMLQTLDWRIFFNLEDSTFRVDYPDRFDAVDYGMLQGLPDGNRDTALPAGMDLEAYREALRALSLLIENNQVFPARPPNE